MNVSIRCQKLLATESVNGYGCETVLTSEDFFDGATPQAVCESTARIHTRNWLRLQT